MKSFADWTDEIRALMNPPKPELVKGFDLAAGSDTTVYGLRDTCNWGLGTEKISAKEFGERYADLTPPQVCITWPFRQGKSWVQEEWLRRAREVMSQRPTVPYHTADALAVGTAVHTIICDEFSEIPDTAWEKLTPETFWGDL